jgi:hypothetical protein
MVCKIVAHQAFLNSRREAQVIVGRAAEMV